MNSGRCNRCRPVHDNGATLKGVNMPLCTRILSKGTQIKTDYMFCGVRKEHGRCEAFGASGDREINTDVTTRYVGMASLCSPGEVREFCETYI